MVMDGWRSAQPVLGVFLIEIRLRRAKGEKMKQRIETAKQAIDLLGGPAKVAAMFEQVGTNTVSNWRERGLPAKAWMVLAPKLKDHRSFFPINYSTCSHPNRTTKSGGSLENEPGHAMKKLLLTSSPAAR
jgi:hypothetical protein